MLISLGKMTPNGKEVILKELENGCICCVSHCRDKDGYTRIFYNGKHDRLFRVIYEKTFGPIPYNMVVRHICDNPYCCNIKHLLLGTQKDNVTDMWERNRQRDYTKNLCMGCKNGANKLTETQVKEIYLSDKTLKELAELYDVTKTNISYIKHKLIWKWLTETLG